MTLEGRSAATVAIGDGGKTSAGDINSIPGRNDFQKKLREAVAALPESGGAIEILPGEYVSLGDDRDGVVIDKPGVTIHISSGADILHSGVLAKPLFEVAATAERFSVLGDGKPRIRFQNMATGFNGIVVRGKTPTVRGLRLVAVNPALGAFDSATLLKVEGATDPIVTGNQITPADKVRGIHVKDGNGLELMLNHFTPDVDEGFPGEVPLIPQAVPTGTALVIEECEWGNVALNKFYKLAKLDTTSFPGFGVPVPYDRVVQYIGDGPSPGAQENGHMMFLGNSFESCGARCMMELRGAAWTDVVANRIGATIGALGNLGDAAIKITSHDGTPTGRASWRVHLEANQLHNVGNNAGLAAVGLFALGSGIWIENAFGVSIQGGRISDQQHAWGIYVVPTNVRGITIDGVHFHRVTGPNDGSIAPIHIADGALPSRGQSNIDDHSGIDIGGCLMDNYAAGTPLVAKGGTPGSPTAQNGAGITNGPVNFTGLIDTSTGVAPTGGTAIQNLSTNRRINV